MLLMDKTPLFVRRAYCAEDMACVWQEETIGLPENDVTPERDWLLLHNYHLEWIHAQKAGRLVPRGSDLVALEHSSYDEANVEIAAHMCVAALGRGEVGWSRAPARSQADAPSLVGTKPQVGRRRHATVADGAQ